MAKPPAPNDYGEAAGAGNGGRAIVDDVESAADSAGMESG